MLDINQQSKRKAIIEAIERDENNVLIVLSLTQDLFWLNDVCISLPVL